MLNVEAALLQSQIAHGALSGAGQLVRGARLGDKLVLLVVAVQ